MNTMSDSDGEYPDSDLEDQADYYEYDANDDPLVEVLEDENNYYGDGLKRWYLKPFAEPDMPSWKDELEEIHAEHAENEWLKADRLARIALEEETLSNDPNVVPNSPIGLNERLDRIEQQLASITATLDSISTMLQKH